MDTALIAMADGNLERLTALPSWIASVGSPALTAR